MKTQCPHCKAGFEVPESYVGKRAKCAKCQQAFLVSWCASPTNNPQVSPVTSGINGDYSKRERAHTSSNGASTTNPKLEVCTNCGAKIGMLEQAHLYQGNVVCSECNQKLNIQERMPPPHTSSAQTKKQLETEAEIIKIRPAMFRNDPVRFFICILLIPFFGIGILFLVIWWLICINTMLTITTRKTVLRKGILSKHTNEVRHNDIRNIRIQQGFFQRIFGVGTLELSTAAQSDIELRVKGIERPQKIADYIRQYQG